jgi:D-tyrosyl-tRNA(Tyr) deacylase
MLALIQRVTSASVTVNSQIIAHIENGILALIGIEKTDTETHADKLLEKMLHYRIFSDDKGKMNLNGRGFITGVSIYAGSRYQIRNSTRLFNSDGTSAK